MENFADLFKKERIESGKTFREIANYIEKSIGYLSDIENKRRNPPDLSVVEKIEECFGITDKRLTYAARKARVNLKTGLNILIQAKPELQELLLRADSLPEDKFNDLLKEIRILTKESENEDSCLFLNEVNRNFYDWRNYRNQ